MKLFVSILLIALFTLQLSFAVDEKHACGATSLYHLATILGIEVSLDKTDTVLKEKQEGNRVASFAELIDCAKEIGLELQGVKLTYTQMQTFDTPVIAHLKTTFAKDPSAADGAVGHFVVVEHATPKWVRLFDTPHNTLYNTATVVSRDRFLEFWTGKTLTLSQKQQRRWHSALSATPMLHDFGKGKAGEYQISVQLQNRSNAPLKILNIAADCNCAVAKRQTDVIPAGGITTLDVNWDAQAMNRSLFTTIQIQTDTPKRPYIFISLGLIREFSLVFTPETLSLSGTGTSTLKKIVDLQNLNEIAVKIQRIEGSQKWIQPVLRSNTIIPPWRRANIELYFEKEQLPRDVMINETLTVHYVEDSGETKTLILPISGKVNQRYTLTPNRFFFGRIKAAEGNTKAVVLRNQSDTNIQIEKVETDVGTVQAHSLIDENHYELQLTLPPRLPTGILKGEVRIHTNHPKNRLIKVPVFGIVVK
ncbi:MAG: DUF1573 domain-containing protein [Candidatus Poribacteria bacterium]|nr:DUF1573 domain-containing protein [Candidatus Poribacteria bacterium]